MIDTKIRVWANINKPIKGEEIKEVYSFIYRSSTETLEIREMGDVKTWCSIQYTRLPDRID